MKLCKDCKHFEPDREFLTFWRKRVTYSAIKYAKCGESHFASPVSGLGEQFCTILRDHEMYCGKEARFWEPKQ